MGTLQRHAFGRAVRAWLPRAYRPLRKGHYGQKATLTISSKNYSSWSLRGWLLTRFSGLEFDEVITAPDDASARAEILLLSSSILVPCLRPRRRHRMGYAGDCRIPQRGHADAGLLPPDRVLRDALPFDSAAKSIRDLPPCAHPCRSNLKGHFPGFKIWSRAQADIESGLCDLARMPGKSGGPFLFGERSHGGRDVRAGCDPLHDL